jgi:hypothetical protein
MIPFKRIAFNSHKMHNPSADIVEGYFEDGSLMTYYIGIKGKNTGIEGMEYYTGTNYALPGTPASKKPSFSRQFSVNKIPKKFKDNWEYLKKTYNEKYAQQTETTKLKETVKTESSIHLTPTQIKLKKVLKPIVEGILNEVRFKTVKVTYSNGMTMTTSINPNLSDNEILSYYKIGTKVNIGNGDKDRMVTIKKAEMLEPSEFDY